ncbi:hypothetical protein HDU76_009368, partial [Blyttiomyces sp. JEL0837]
VLEFLRSFPGVIFHQSFPRRCFYDVQYWLKHSGVAALQINQKYLSDAILLGGLDVVKLLVEFPGVDVTFGNNSAIKCSVRSAVVTGKAIDRNALADAAGSGKGDVVKLLLAAPDVDAFADDSNGFANGGKRVMLTLEGYVKVVELLLQNVVHGGNEFLRMLKNVGAKEFVNMFEVFKDIESRVLVNREQALSRLKTRFEGL